MSLKQGTCKIETKSLNHTFFEIERNLLTHKIPRNNTIARLIDLEDAEMDYAGLSKSVLESCNRVRVINQ